MIFKKHIGTTELTRSTVFELQGVHLRSITWKLIYADKHFLFFEIEKYFWYFYCNKFSLSSFREHPCWQWARKFDYANNRCRTVLSRVDISETFSAGPLWFRNQLWFGLFQLPEMLRTSLIQLWSVLEDQFFRPAKLTLNGAISALISSETVPFQHCTLRDILSNSADSALTSVEFSLKQCWTVFHGFIISSLCIEVPLKRGGKFWFRKNT